MLQFPIPPFSILKTRNVFAPTFLSSRSLNVEPLLKGHIIITNSSIPTPPTVKGIPTSEWRINPKMPMLIPSIGSSEHRIKSLNPSLVSILILRIIPPSSATWQHHTLSRLPWQFGNRNIRSTYGYDRLLGSEVGHPLGSVLASSYLRILLYSRLRAYLYTSDLDIKYTKPNKIRALPPTSANTTPYERQRGIFHSTIPLMSKTRKTAVQNNMNLLISFIF